MRGRERVKSRVTKLVKLSTAERSSEQDLGAGSQRRVYAPSHLQCSMLTAVSDMAEFLIVYILGEVRRKQISLKHHQVFFSAKA